ncbi:MAG TPA: nuclease-related domain-containing protein [Candidatus Binatia bacterium]|jgi:hypothetical protein
MWQKWIFGRRGDLVAVEALKSLSGDYIVLNDLVLPDGRTRIDRVVIGPNGLFAIEDKDCAADVKCKGHDWYFDRRRIPSLDRQAGIKALALRRALVSVTYEGEKRIPAVVAVLVFTNPGARVDVVAPAVPAMRVEDLASFIVRHKGAALTAAERGAIMHHLVSFQTPRGRRRSFFGMGSSRAPARKLSAAPAARAQFARN